MGNWTVKGSVTKGTLVI